MKIIMNSGLNDVNIGKELYDMQVSLSIISYIREEGNGYVFAKSDRSLHLYM